MTKAIKLSDVEKRKRIAEIKDILVLIRKDQSVRREIKRVLLN
jgi:hypothetical protein